MSNEMVATLANFGPIILMVLIFYFLLYKPQQKARQERETMLGSLKVGDEVITIGGVFGKIKALTDEVVTLKIADNVEIKIARSSINGVNTEEKETAQS
ncbi:MAG: preprotein translocase subunit YajC [Selenomonadaceae bacterium]|nr:preprotein translocase subunit YajC [Selenomonadaceae bacterium]